MPALASQAGLYTAQNQLDDLVYGPSDIAPPVDPALAPAGPNMAADPQAYQASPAPLTPTAAPATLPAAQPATLPAAPVASPVSETAMANPQGTTYLEGAPATAPPGAGYSPPTNSPSAAPYPAQEYQYQSDLNQNALQQPADPYAPEYAQAQMPASYQSATPGTNPTREFGAFEDAPVNADTVQRYEDSIYRREPASDIRTLPNPDPSAEFRASVPGIDPSQWDDLPNTVTGAYEMLPQGVQDALEPDLPPGTLGLGDLGMIGTGPVRGLSPAARYAGDVEAANVRRVGSRTATTPDVVPEQMPPRPRPGTVVSEAPRRVTVGPLETTFTGPRSGRVSPRNPVVERATGPVGSEPGGAIPLPAQSGAPRPAPMPEAPLPLGTLSPRAQAALDTANLGRRSAAEIADAQLTERVAAPFRPGTEPSPGVVRPQGEPPPIVAPEAAPVGAPVAGRRPILSNRAKVAGLAGAGLGLAAYGQATETGRMGPSDIAPLTPKTKQPGVVGDPWDGQMVGSTEAQPIAIATAADGSTLEVPPIRKVIFANGEVAASEPVPISQQAYDAAIARGEEPWLMTAEEAATLVAAGLIEEGVGAALVGQTVMAVPGWVEALRAAEGTASPTDAASAGGAAPTTIYDPLSEVGTRQPITQVYPINGSAPQTAAPATAPSTGGGDWVDYGSSGGGGRSYGGGGRGYPATYPSDFGGDEGSESPWDNPIFDRFFATAGGQLTGLRGRTTDQGSGRSRMTSSRRGRRSRPTTNRRSRSGKSQSPMPMPPLHGSDDALALRDR